MEIPTSVFDGFIKQISSNGMTKEGKEWFEHLFPVFLSDEDMASQLQKMGVNKVIYSYGSRITSTGRLRRYSGGSALPRERYFSVCSDASGNDSGTLVSEVMAYSTHDKKIQISLVDSTIDKEGATVIEDAGKPPYPKFLAVVIFNLDSSGNPVGGAEVVTYKIGVYQIKVDRALDLRLRGVQDWFCSTFVDLENTLGQKGFDGVSTTKGTPSNFRELLPTLLIPSKGGGTFHDAAGKFLIDNGVQALIYPSSRTTVNVSSSSNEVYDFDGWNVVVYGNDQENNKIIEECVFGYSGGWARDGDCGISRIEWNDDGKNRKWSVRR